ncbi:MAG: adenylosuccinate lyase [candidate division NC10 bacterium]|nr:adenylosuccinate lyase [candidate division NC10 bacterium]
MIGRYSRPAMARLWEDRTRFDLWLRIEVLACEAWAKLGEIPAEALRAIQERAGYDAERVAAVEREVKHEVIAFLTAVAERVGPAARYLHRGLTSSDVMDTALAVQMRDAADLLLEGLDALRAALRRLALAHKETRTVGRTHGVHAEPITFGLKVARWYAEMGRNRERLLAARAAAAVGKVSGAVGTFAHVPPAVEEFVCQRLGLTAEPVSSQIVPRDRHAQYMLAVALTGAALENAALEIRHLQRTEVGEVEEPFTEGQKGSSAMPHKRNPVGCEQICGLARVLRTNAFAALENVALWHERDISHSSVERIILPDSTILLDYLLHRFTGIIEGLRVHPERMRANLTRSAGLVASERVLLALTDKGLSREEAYRLVQGHAMRTWEEGGDFAARLTADPVIRRHLSEAELTACFAPEPTREQVETLFERAGLLDRETE